MSGASSGRPAWTRGVAARIALAAVLAASIAVAVVSLGVILVGSAIFAELMVQHGSSAEVAHQMFDQSVTVVVLVAVAAGVVAAAALALLLGQRLAGPLIAMGRAARRIAAGDYAARVPRGGPEEIASLADSFNQMAAALQEQERLRREFIANAAHGLRTPLTNLQGYLEGLRDGVIPAEPATFASLWDEAERLRRLAASLDTLAEGDAATTPPRRVEIDLVATIRSALELSTPGFERAGITLVTALSPTLPVLGDPDDLAQVLGNLLQNAIRYTPSGGHVTVRAEQRPGDVLVTVANTGEGIPQDDLAHVFERFYRVDKSRDRAHGGAGIGLAIVRQMVEGAGGRVGAESGEGLTRFWFSLPT